MDSVNELSEREKVQVVLKLNKYLNYEDKHFRLQHATHQFQQRVSRINTSKNTSAASFEVHADHPMLQSGHQLGRGQPMKQTMLQNYYSSRQESAPPRLKPQLHQTMPLLNNTRPAYNLWKVNNNKPTRQDIAG